MQVKKYLVLPFLLFGCASPIKPIESKIVEFKKKYPDHIQAYSTAHRKMQYAWSGDPKKPPLVFVHGSPGSWEAWAGFLMDEKLQRDFHILSVDRPGFGGSAFSGSEPSLKIQAQDIIGVLDFNSSGRPAIVIGHSYGGAVIAQMALDFPERVSGLVFVASSVDPSLEKKKWIQEPATWWPIRVLIPTSLRSCNEEILALKDELNRLEPRWTQMRARVATIQGTADDLVPPENQRFILKNTAPERLVLITTVEGMNHFVPWQHPELIRDAIEKLQSP